MHKKRVQKWGLECIINKNEKNCKKVLTSWSKADNICLVRDNEQK